MLNIDPIDLALSAGNNYNNDYLIHFRANENLTELFKNFDVKDKKVLTVLASSDQAFSCFYYGAKSIDTFDKSYIALYYYYLRKWLLLYKNRVYPPTDFFKDGDINIYNMIKRVETESKDEENAKIFWLTYLERNNYKSDDYLFEGKFSTKGNVPFINDKEKIIPMFDKPLKFTLMDISNPAPINEKYDVVILSNILEYFKFKESRLAIRDNIEKLLNPGGVAICSYKSTYTEYNTKKKEIEILTSNKLVLGNDIKDLAYSYVLK